jgi:hypothetical protein
MAHTPAPWLRESQINSEGSDWIIVTKDYKEIVDLRLDDGLVVSEDEQEANAALIAAAPELLDALRDAADAIDLAQAQVDSENDRYTLCKRLVAVKRAIAKAEGRHHADT